MVLKIV